MLTGDSLTQRKTISTMGLIPRGNKTSTKDLLPRRKKVSATQKSEDEIQSYERYKPKRSTGISNKYTPYKRHTPYVKSKKAKKSSLVILVKNLHVNVSEQKVLQVFRRNISPINYIKIVRGKEYAIAFIKYKACGDYANNKIWNAIVEQQKSNIEIKFPNVDINRLKMNEELALQKEETRIFTIFDIAVLSEDESRINNIRMCNRKVEISENLLVYASCKMTKENDNRYICKILPYISDFQLETLGACLPGRKKKIKKMHKTHHVIKVKGNFVTFKGTQQVKQKEKIDSEMNLAMKKRKKRKSESIVKRKIKRVEEVTTQHCTPGKSSLPEITSSINKQSSETIVHPGVSGERFDNTNKQINDDIVEIDERVITLEEIEKEIGREKETHYGDARKSGFVTQGQLYEQEKQPEYYDNPYVDNTQSYFYLYSNKQHNTMMSQGNSNMFNGRAPDYSQHSGMRRGFAMTNRNPNMFNGRAPGSGQHGGMRRSPVQQTNMIYQNHVNLVNVSQPVNNGIYPFGRPRGNNYFYSGSLEDMIKSIIQKEKSPKLSKKQYDYQPDVEDESSGEEEDIKKEDKQFKPQAHVQQYFPFAQSLQEENFRQKEQIREQEMPFEQLTTKLSQLEKNQKVNK